MLYAWPPTGRISENYAQRDKAFAFLPKSKIVGKVGYALMPGGNGEHAGSFVQCVSADSKNPGGGIPLQPVADQSVDFAAGRDAAVHAA